MRHFQFYCVCKCNLTCGGVGNSKKTYRDWLPRKVLHLCGPLDPEGSGMMRAQIKEWNSRLQKREGGWVEAGVQANLKLGPKPGTACHAPGFIQARIKEPWKLSRATQTNYSNKQQASPSPPPTTPEATRLTSQRETNGPGPCCPVDWTLTSLPSRWPSVSNFVCLFVYSRTPETAVLGRVIFTELRLKGVGKKKASNYMWFSPSWGIMAMLYLIGRDKLGCEWA